MRCGGSEGVGELQVAGRRSQVGSRKSEVGSRNGEWGMGNEKIFNREWTRMDAIFFWEIGMGSRGWGAD